MDNIKILIVEDDDLLRRTIGKILKREKLNYGEASNGNEAIEKVNEENFDIVISDVRMPGIDGIETITEIKKLSPNIKSIIMTGFASDDTPIKALRLGVNDYLYKPFELEEFLHCINRNIDMIKLERNNKQLNEEKLQKEKLALIGNMTSVIVHDVKNSLTPILGFAKLLESNESLDEKGKRFAEIIYNQSVNVLDKLKEMLQFARGEINIEQKETDVKEIYLEILKEKEKIIIDSEVNFISNFSDELEGIKIKVDIERLKQAITNILGNAQDAVSKSEDKNIELNFHKEDDKYCIIEIKDSGKGIPDDIINSIFIPFKTFGKAYGTGLGLAIVKDVIDKHDGEIKVESKKDEFTKFIIKLKLV
ncbi:ATP-binding response regulator [Haliovirga abyssi]|uniref:histidine kinase n=1 Tax=Haliovirga abyssi TaxID=2996794 RepID=A0AAU9D9E8_9FUSO|nr:hybrid sensor histidine kinase/response regulator [Haliovirga abyssi]BDU49915.1 hybrid sensor histidine kinase/response regulator [Haliovirga abyssi]